MYWGWRRILVWQQKIPPNQSTQSKCLQYTKHVFITLRLHSNLLRLTSKTRDSMNRHIFKLPTLCFPVWCLLERPVLSGFRSGCTLWMWPLLWAGMKVKANFPSVQSNTLWTASVVELTSTQVVLLSAAVNLTGARSGLGVQARVGQRGAGCAVVPYGEQRVMSTRICWLEHRRAAEQNSV